MLPCERVCLCVCVSTDIMHETSVNELLLRAWCPTTTELSYGPFSVTEPARPTHDDVEFLSAANRRASVG